MSKYKLYFFLLSTVCFTLPISDRFGGERERFTTNYLTPSTGTTATLPVSPRYFLIIPDPLFATGFIRQNNSPFCAASPSISSPHQISYHSTMTTTQSTEAALTFDILLSRLTSSAITNEHALNLFNLHKQFLFEVIPFSSSPSTNPNDIKYLRHPDATARFPAPTAAEEACIQSLCTRSSISRSHAANLLRDYLYTTVTEPLATVLEKSTDLTNAAPLTALQNFWFRQRRAAFSVISTILVAASDPHLYPWHVAAAAFVKEHNKPLTDAIVRAANDALASFDDTSSNNLSPLFPLPASWYFELLFALTLSTDLSVADRHSLLTSYKALVTRKQAFSARSPSPDSRTVSSPILDGAAASVLFSTAINHANAIRAVTHSFTRDSMSSQVSAHPTIDPTIGQLDTSTVQRLDALYTAIRSTASPETAILAFSWASLRQLKLQGHYSNLTLEPETEVTAIIKHMSYAVSTDAFDVLQRFSSHDIPLPSLLAPYVSRCLWDDIVAFFCAFPPRDFVPAQVSQMVNLATSVLRSMSERDVIQVTKHLWDAESSKRSFIGANAILRIASGIFPQTFRPLVNFLIALTVDDSSAKNALVYLSEGLISVTERSEAYKGDLFVLEDDEDDIISAICSQRGFDIEVINKLFEMVCPSSDEVIYVQAGSDIAADTYRPMLSRGSIGVSNVSQTVVTWVMPWNGFGAIARILQFLLTVLHDQDHAILYSEYVLEELSITAADSMMLIERLFCSGSSEVAHEFLADTELVRIIASIVAEVADPGDRTRSFWLTRSRQEQLLTTAASFLASITCGSSDRARFALETLELSKNLFPLHNAVSYLGRSAFPAVAAIVQIAYVSSHGDVVSPDLRALLSASYPTGEGRVMTRAPQWFGKSPALVMELLTRSALPLWLTSSARESAYTSVSQPLHWLLPTCTLDLFSADPLLMLQSPVVSSVFTAAVVAACESNESSQTSDVDTFLFPALRSALMACYMALKERNRLLQARHKSGDVKNDDMCMEAYHTSDEPCTLEKTLLKPDITYAMALLSAGSTKKLRNDDFFEGWMTPKFKRYLPECDTDRFWTICPSAKHPNGDAPSFWRSWVVSMSARCLSLQFCCLSQLGRKPDAIQVAWPTINNSSFGNWRGGGDIIRKAYSLLIEGDSPVPLLELLVTILSCGQRAAARSLMAPRSRLSATRMSSNAATGPGEIKQVTNTTIAGSNAKGEGNVSDNSSEIMSSVVKCLRVQQEQWSKKMCAIVSKELDIEDIRTMIDMGQTCLVIAACVRFLRVAWESYNSKWFEACWKDLEVWEMLADLVRCEGSGSKQSDKTDFTKAIKFPEIPLSKLEEKAGKLNDEEWNQLRVLTRDFAVTVDVSSCWKGIAADVLQVFASEIVYKTTANLSAKSEEASTGKGEETDKLPFEVYNEGTFAVFSSVFTEKWMKVLFNPGEEANQIKLTESVERARSPRLLRAKIKDSEGQRSRISVEECSREISECLAKLVFADHRLSQEDILRFFNRDGDVATRFGVDYSFDTGQLVRLVQMVSGSADKVKSVVYDVGRLNLQLTKEDVQAGVVSAFSAMASAVVFADAFCPQPALLLSYSSPQFGGKVCRFLCRFLVHIAPSLSSSVHAAAIASVISKLTASLSTRLSADELEQAALTNVRFHAVQLDEKVSSLNSVGQLAYVIDHLMKDIEGISKESALAREKLEIVQWSLFTAAKLAKGVAFRSRSDLMALTKCCVNVLRMAGHSDSVCGASSVALSAVLEQRVDGWFASLESADVEVIFRTIRTLSCGNGVDREQVWEISSNLLLIVAQGYCLQGTVNKSTRSFILRQLSSGVALGLLPSEGESIGTYAAGSKSRNATHIFWCACLRLASVVIMDEFGSHNNGGAGEEEVGDVLEFCSASLGRIGRDSLNLSGDWPPVQSLMDSNVSRVLTIAKIEEAEVASVTMFKLSRYAFQMRSVLPELLGAVAVELMRYTEQVVRLLRAEPIERWVRPITQREREQSFLYHGERDGLGNLATIGGGGGSSGGGNGESPRWNGGSPGRGQPSSGAASPPKRSPMQAVRAAVGDSSGRSSPVPSSPGLTPFSPSLGTPGSGQLPSSSPLSPWIPYGSGLISESGLYFGEEVMRSLLRGLAAVLSTLRRLAFELDETMFGPSLSSGADERPGLGCLLGVLHHAGGELQRGTNDERRSILLGIAENALIMLVFHVNRFNEQGVLPQAARDEVRKRIPTYLTRMRRSVPPPPNSSVLVAVGIDRFWEQLR